MSGAMNMPVSQLVQPAFLPVNGEEMRALGWDELDVLLVSGDAYVDHPSFASALLGRWLVAHGFRTGIIAQPRWDVPDDLLRMGRPRLFAGVAGGNVDSMLAHYTAFRKKRSDDAYTPGGLAGKRPNRAVIVYANLLRQAFPALPVILGGIEASLRRVTHFDFWTNSLRRSILLDAKADLLVYGMGELAIVEAARRLEKNLPLTGIAGTAFAGNMADVPALAGNGADTSEKPVDVLVLPSHEMHLADRDALMAATLLLERHVHQGRGWACQPLTGNITATSLPVDAFFAPGGPSGRAILIAPPAPRLRGEQLDALYALPFSRQQHPAYTQPVPACEMIAASITTHRGCGGGCAFCSLALHQGRRIASRGRQAILDEVRMLAAMPGLHGVISDLGGPSANMWNARCTLQKESDCQRVSCMHPAICPHFKADQAACVDLLRSAAAVPGVRNVRVASGVRFDLALTDQDAVAAYTREFTGGQLKIAPEHICDPVLRLMRKPPREVFERFVAAFQRQSARAGKEQYVVPYLISAHPGCTEAHMRELSAWLKERNWSPRQVQCFIPTPGTVATAMFYTGKDPSGRSIAVAVSDAERMRQHALLAGQWGNAARQERDRPVGEGKLRAQRGHGRDKRAADARTQHRENGNTGRPHGAARGQGRSQAAPKPLPSGKPAKSTTTRPPKGRSGK